MVLSWTRLPERAFRPALAAAGAAARTKRSGLFHPGMETIKGDLMMAIESHLATLEKKHGALEQEISEAMASPAMDDLHIASLKRRKLVLKEQIEKLRIEATRH